MAYVEPITRSCFSLLEGASQPTDLVAAAAESGASAVGVMDRDAIYGVVQAHTAAKEHNIKLLCGAQLTISGAPAVAVYAKNFQGWSSLMRLITAGRANSAKGWCAASVEQLAQHSKGCSILLRHGWTAEQAAPLKDAFKDDLRVAWSQDLTATDTTRTRWAADLAKRLECKVVPTNDVLFHRPNRQMLADVLTCIRRKTTLPKAGRSLAANRERYLLGEAEFRHRYRALNGAVENGLQMAEAVHFTLDELEYQYPREVVPSGQSPISWLTTLTHEGLANRYPEGVPESVMQQVKHELGVIEKLNFPSYFLTVHDIVAFARSRKILCQGRGSAANSAVCFALGITAVDPSRTQLLFERFISEERGEPPDIDVDFEHERREEVIQYVYARYGRDRAALVNEFICYRGRSAIRDVGKVFGLSIDQVDRLAKSTARWPEEIPIPPPGRGIVTLPKEISERVLEAGLDPTSQAIVSTMTVSQQLRGFPRHVSIHVGGFVIAADKLIDLVPVEPATMVNRTVIQWDKYDVDALRFVKVDLLALGMLTAIRKGFELIHEYHKTPLLTLATVPSEDPAVYDMFCKADTVGVFQIESRAQMSMLPRLRPRCFYDLVIEVALVRPGPIQGGMVHPYLARRNHEEPITYAHPDLIPILERTLGVPLFQEQVMAMAVAVGGFTGGEADQLRRSMGTWKKRGNLQQMGEKMVQGMVDRGIAREYAQSVFSQILGFGEYGFPESHSASFALLVYISGWLRCHHLAAFTAALINSQPMGFYSPRALIADAQRHDVVARAMCISHSNWDCTLETDTRGKPAIRVGFRLLKGLRKEHAEAIVACREREAFTTLADFARRTRLPHHLLQLLADANCFDTVAKGRRKAAWKLQGLWTDLPLFSRQMPNEPTPNLPEMSETDALRADFRTVGLSVDTHPMELMRNTVAQLGCVPLLEAKSKEPGSFIRTAGLISSRQSPSTASGVVFLTLEDETAMVNFVCWPKIWERFRRLATTVSMIGIDGTLQRDGDAVSVLIKRFWPLPKCHEEHRAPLDQLNVRPRNFH